MTAATIMTNATRIPDSPTHSVAPASEQAIARSAAGLQGVSDNVHVGAPLFRAVGALEVFSHLNGGSR